MHIVTTARRASRRRSSRAAVRTRRAPLMPSGYGAAPGDEDQDHGQRRRALLNTSDFADLQGGALRLPAARPGQQGQHSQGGSRGLPPARGSSFKIPREDCGSVWPLAVGVKSPCKSDAGFHPRRRTRSRRKLRRSTGRTSGLASTTVYPFRIASQAPSDSGRLSFRRIAMPRQYDFGIELLARPGPRRSRRPRTRATRRCRTA